MSIATKLCANVFSVGLRSLSNCNNAFQTLASRSFHMMARPIVIGTAATMPIIAPVPTVQRLLAPVNSILTQVAGFKVKGRLRRRCKDCYFVVRHQRHYVICPTHPRHKQMSMKKRDYKSWILTHATQSKIRPY